MSEGPGYNPNRDAHGKFAPGPGKPPSWKGEVYKTGSTNAKDHADRAAWERDRAKQYALNAKAETDPVKAKAYEVLAAKSADKAQRCADRAIKAAAKNPTDEQARHVARAMKSAQEAREHVGAKTKAADKPEKIAEKIPEKHEETTRRDDPPEHLDSLSSAELNEHADRIYKKCTKEEKAAIFDDEDGMFGASYTGEGFVSINKGLRHPPPPKSVEKQITVMDKVFEKDSAEHDMIVHRGNGQKTPFDVSSWKPGHVYEDKAYVSTSISESTAKGFGGPVFHIHVPKGHPVVHIGDRSENDTEGEILLPRGSKFKVLKIEKKSGGWGGSTQYHVHMRAIDYG